MTCDVDDYVDGDARTMILLAMIMMMRSKVKAKEVKDARRDFVAPQFITIGRKRAGHHDEVDDGEHDHGEDNDGDDFLLFLRGQE